MTAQKERRPGGSTPRRLKGVKDWIVDAFILPHTPAAVKGCICRGGAILAAAVALVALDGIFGVLPWRAVLIFAACCAASVGLIHTAGRWAL